MNQSRRAGALKWARVPALTTPPRRKKLYSSILSFPAASSILEHIWKENSSLWRSNRPRHVNLNKH